MKKREMMKKTNRIIAILLTIVLFLCDYPYDMLYVNAYQQEDNIVKAENYVDDNAVNELEEITELEQKSIVYEETEEVDSTIELSKTYENYANSVNPNSEDSIVASGSCGESITWSLNNTGVLSINGTGAMDDYEYSAVNYQVNSPYYKYRYDINEIKISEGITSIGTYAFAYCFSVKEIVIPDTVTAIRNNAFYSCVDLTKVVIPESVETVGGSSEGVFGNCINLTTVGPIGGEYNIEYGWKKKIPNEAFRDSYVSEVNIRDGIDEIGDDAFYGTQLIEADVPATVEKIGKGAFASNMLEHVVIRGKTTLLSYGGFGYTNKIKTAGPIGGGYDYEFSWTDNIPGYAFGGFNSLEYIQIPATVNKMEPAVFYGSYLSKLKTAGPIGGGYNIEYGWKTSIPENAFFGCDGLETVYFPKSVTTIGSCAFHSCSNLKSVKFPEKLTRIESSAFHGCHKLEEAKLPSDLEVLGRSAFNLCSSLSEVNIPGSVQEIESDVFYECSGITRVTIEEGVERIDGGAFFKCPIMELTLPQSLCMFNKASIVGTNITRLTIPSGCISGGSGWSSWHSGSLTLEELTFEDGLIGIGNILDNTRYGGVYPKIINIPESVTYIEENAIKNCYGLTDIYYGGSKKSWDKIYINSSNDDLSKVTIHYAKDEDSEEGSQEDVSYFTVTFMMKRDSNNMVKRRVRAGSRINFTDPVWKLHDFVGWYEDDDLTMPYDMSRKIDGDFTLYAKWEKAKKAEIEAPAFMTYTKMPGKDREEDGYLEIKWNLQDFMKQGGSATTYNHRLAIAGLALSAAANATFTSGGGTVIKRTMENMGFSNILSLHYEETDLFENLWHPGISFGAQMIKDETGADKLLVAVTVRGTTTLGDIFSDAASLVDGFSVAGANSYDDLKNYITSAGAYFNIVPTKNNTILFITGHSYGGAVTGRLAQSTGSLAEQNNTYVYAYAAPKYVSNLNNYSNVFNIINKDDRVPKLISAPTYFRVGNHRYYEPKSVSDKMAFHMSYMLLTGFGETYENMMSRAWNDFKKDANFWTWNKGAFESLRQKICFFPTGEDLYASTAHDVRAYMAYLLADSNPSDIANDFSWLISVECPVDVEVYDTDGTLMAWTRNNQVEYGDYTEVIILTEGDKKYINITQDKDYKIKLIATDEGQMKYSVRQMAVEGSEIITEQVYENVELSEGKTMLSPFDAVEEASDVSLFVIEEDGEITHQILTDGSEVEYTGNDDDSEKDDSEYDSVLPEDMPADGQIPDGLWLGGVKSVTYDGTKKTQQFRVYDGIKRLNENSDYTVKYKNNINAYTLTEEEEGFSYAKAPTITVTGKGDYSGTIVKNFVIQPIDLSTYSDVAVTDVFVGEDSKGKVQKLKPAVTVMIDGKSVSLKEGKDIQYDYPSEVEKAYISPGVYDITITGIGNYTGTIEPNVKETIVDTTATKLLSKMSITTGTATLSDADYVVGEKVVPAANTIVVKDTKLTSGQQVLTGKYCDSKEEATAAINDQSIIDAGIHYVYYCTNNTVPGNGKIIFMGVKANGYEGTVIKTYKVSGYTLKGFVVEGVDAAYPFTGKEIEPAGKAGEVTLPVDLPFKVCKKGKNGDILSQLVKGVNYKVDYINHVNAGTATIVITGINNYSGVLKKTFKITAKAGTEEKGSMVVEDISSQIYVKTGVKPAVVVKDADTGEVLKLGKDYTLTYSNNKKVHSGKAEDDTKKNPAPKVVVKGIKNYSGTVTKLFGIQNSSLSNANISMLVSDVMYKEAPGQCKPAITLYDIDGSKLNVGKDYETAMKYTYEMFTDAEGNPTDSIKSITIKTKNGKVSGTATRAVGDEVKPEDIVPVNTVISAEVTGKGFYGGTGDEDSTVSKTFRYTAKSISKMKVIVVTQTYTGKQLKPDFSNGDVKVYDGTTPLEGGTDYTIEGYGQNINKGTGKLTIKGKGNYGGYKEVSFKITQKTMGYTITYDRNLEQAKEKFGENVNISGTMKNGTISTGTKLAKCNYKLTDSNRKTYTFVGWCTKPNPVDEKDGYWYSDQETFRMKGLIQMLFGKKQTLYAQWKK